jgi:MFS family permease
MKKLGANPLIQSLIELRGNPRACVYTEPLWGIPHSLYTPFISVYMAALLLSDRQIGLVASVSLFFRAGAALFSGAVTDKLGRKMTTLVFDILSWSIPCLLWAFSQNFWWFVIAASFNGMWQITDNSWTCLLVEDAEKSAMVKIFSLVHMSGHIAVVFAPLAALLVNRLSIVPAVRILYIFSFLSMTAKFIILYIYCEETIVGKVRRTETAGMSVWRVMSGYGGILRKIFASPEMILALVLSAIFTVTGMVMWTFFGLYTTGRLLIPEHFLAYFPILRSLVIAVFLFIFQPKLDRFGFRRPMLAGLLFYGASHIVLIFTPGDAAALILLYVCLEAIAYSLVLPRSDSLTALLIEPSERARIRGLMTVVILSFSIPFGYLAGWLSDIDRRLPFMLNCIIFAIAFVIIAANKQRLDNAA